MEDLASRMAYQAATAISPAYGPATMRKACLAVSAALRELDRAVMEQVLADAEPIDLAKLADAIENGSSQ